MAVLADCEYLQVSGESETVQKRSWPGHSSSRHFFRTPIWSNVKREQKKLDVERAYQKMTAAEKEVFNQKMAEYDEADADDGETPPPTPTPV